MSTENETLTIANAGEACRSWQSPLNVCAAESRWWWSLSSTNTAPQQTTISPTHPDTHDGRDKDTNLVPVGNDELRHHRYTCADLVETAC